MKRKDYLSRFIVFVLTFLVLFISANKFPYFARYKIGDSNFNDIDKEHEWEVDPDSPAKTISWPEVSYMYDSETDSYTDTLTYSEHSYCAKCGFDISQSFLEGKDGFVEHEKTGCTYSGRITGFYYITVDWPAQYVCKKCKAWKYFNADASQEGMYNQYCIQNKDYDKIIWHISKECTPPSPSPSPSPTPTPSPSPTTNPTTAPTTAPTVAPVATPDKKIEVGDILKNSKAEYKVLNNNTVAFDKCTSKAASFTVPDAIDVDGRIFTITKISRKAFSGNKKVKTVTVGNNITEIESSAFNGCSKLTTVKFKGKKLKKIGTGAFKNCSKLKSISLLSPSLKTISASSFYGCKSLKTITIKSTKVTFGKNSFKGISKKAVFKVPKSKVKTYKKNIINKAKAPSKVTVKKN